MKNPRHRLRSVGNLIPNIGCEFARAERKILTTQFMRFFCRKLTARHWYGYDAIRPTCILSWMPVIYTYCKLPSFHQICHHSRCLRHRSN